MANYQKVSYRSVYPGVDLIYYGNQQQLEYDFVLAPGADPSRIRMHLDGANKIKLNQGGDLVVSTKQGQMVFHRPLVYQQNGGQKQSVDGQFTLLAGNSVGFVLGNYDRTVELIIDPTLTYATYLGGSGYHPPADQDCCGSSGNGIATDLFGSVYVVGTTGSTDFPVSTTAYQSKNNDTRDLAYGTDSNVFISKLDPTGTTLVYSTYLGGSGDYWYKDSGAGIAVDTYGSAYITGYTGSLDFPVTTGAFQSKNNAASTSTGRSAFVTKLTADGSGLLYSTYLGGTGFNIGTSRDGEIGTGIAIDSAGNAFITGSSYSKDFPVSATAFQTSNNAYPIRQNNIFVSKLNTTGTALIYSTYLGGTGISQNCCYYFSGGDSATGIAIDAFGDAYITGYAYSKNFPVTLNAYQTTNRAHNSLNGTGAADTNAVVTKLDPSGSTLLYSTYVGGSGNLGYGDLATGIAIDSQGYAYITGRAGSNDFPTTLGAFQKIDPVIKISSPRPSNFVTKLDVSGSTLVYSTYLSGSGNYNRGDYAAGIAVDSSGQAVVTGTTISWDFPVTPDAFQPTNNQAANPSADYFPGNAFVAELDTTGTGLVYSSYFGGSGGPNGGGGDAGLAVTVDGGGNAYITGTTVSNNLPVTVGAFQTVNKSYTAGRPNSATAFVAQFGIGGALPLIPTGVSLSSSGNPQNTGTNITFLVAVSSLVGIIPTGTITFKIDGMQAQIVVLDSAGKAIFTTNSITAGQHTIVAAYSGTTVFAPSSQGLTETINATNAILFGNITGKSGAKGARSWNIQVSNSGPSPAVGAAVSNIAFVQASGPVCTPGVISGLPISVGDLAPGANTTVPLLLDFSGCSSISRFTVTISLSANGGNSSGSIVRLNQFQ